MLGLFLASLALTEMIIEYRGDGSLTKSSAAEELKFPWHSIRLPQTLFPVSYEIELKTDLKLFQVKGNVKILVTCAKNTANIILHLKEINVSKAAVFEKNHKVQDVPATWREGVIEEEGLIERGKAERNTDRQLPVIGTMKNETLEMFLIEVQEDLTPQRNYEIYMEFDYPLTDKLIGFYRSSYKTRSGQKRYLAATLFEPTFARKAFPCFDEPAMKAKFSVTIIRDGKYTALSNMPIEKTIKIGDDLYADQFQESVRMSTYLVAFLVSDFDYKERTTTSGIKVRVWTPPLQIAQASYALDIATETLSNYEKFFQINFPLPKQDLVAIPDFLAGAMENWGLIGFASPMLLFDPKDTSDDLKQDVCETVTHELAHQWFGNLVTMEWWNDLWLNEGFATYIEDIGASYVEPDWNMTNQFIIHKLQVALNKDQSSYSHPISVDVKDPKQIDSLFDAISYRKGASLIRMLKSFIGSQHFTAGMRSYLQKYAYGNAQTDELWESMSEVSGVNIKEVMDTWTLQMGLPVVNIVRLDEETATADQRRFLIYPDAKHHHSSPFNYRWNIPLTYITQKNNRSVQVWMNRGSASIKWLKTSGWIKANVDQIGYYRVNYEKSNWKALVNQLNTDHAVLNAADRSGLIDDAFHLARSDQLEHAVALDTTLYIPRETEYAPLITFLRNMAYIGNQFLLRKSFKVLKTYMLQQLQQSMERLGWDDKGTHLEKLLRAEILSAACDYSDQTIISKVKTNFKLAMEGKETIATNLRFLVYSIGVQEGGVKEWNQIYNKYLTTHIASDKSILLESLSYTRNPQMIRRCLKYSLDMTKIPAQDTLSVLSGLASKPKSWRMTWNFVRQNWKLLYRRYSRGSDEWPTLIKSLMFKCNTQAQLNEVTNFFKDYLPTDAAYRQVQMGIEQIHANILWLRRHEKEVTQWLQKHVKN